MNDNVYVYSHSPSLSLLLFESLSSSNNTMGLLLGTVQKNVVTSATDENVAAFEERTILYIEHVVPLPSDLFSFYGESNCEKILNWCQPFKNHQIIGWYIFRWNHRDLRLSLRDSLIHTWLQDQFQCKTFVVGLLSSAVRRDQSTHSFRQVFFSRNTHGAFQTVPFKMCSLSDSSTSNDGYLQSLILPESKHFKKLMSTSGLNECSKPIDVNSIRVLQSSACTELSVLGKKLLELEKLRFDAEKEALEVKKISAPRITGETIKVDRNVKPEPQNFLLFDKERDYTAQRTDHEPQQDEPDEDMPPLPTASSSIPIQAAAGDSSYSSPIKSPWSAVPPLSLTKVENDQRRQSLKTDLFANMTRNASEAGDSQSKFMTAISNSSPPGASHSYQPRVTGIDHTSYNPCMGRGGRGRGRGNPADYRTNSLPHETSRNYQSYHGPVHVSPKYEDPPQSPASNSEQEWTETKSRKNRNRGGHKNRKEN